MYQKKFVNYWSSKINDSSGDSKQLWIYLKRLLSIPKSTATIHSPNDFARHFEEKIERIRQSTVTCP